MEENNKCDEINKGFDWEVFAKQHLNWNTAERLNIAHEAVDKHAHDPKKVALICIPNDGKEEKFTFHELKNLSSQFANVLKQLGIKKGDRVARMLPRTVETYVTFLGTWKVGAIDVPLYTAFQPEAIKYRMKDCGAKFIVTDTENREKLEKIERELGSVTIIVVSRNRGLRVRRGDINFWHEVKNAHREFEVVETHADEAAILQYTSGTTGLPKGTVINHRGFIAVIPYPKYMMNVKDEDMVWGFADPAWVYGLLTVGCSLLCTGHPLLVYGGRFTAKRWYEIMEKYEVTNFSAAPTTYRTIIAAGDDLPSQYKLKVRYFTSAGEFLNIEAIRWFERHFGAPISDQYGITEAGMLLGNYPSTKRRAASMGKPFPGFEVKIKDEKGNDVPLGKTGLICAKWHPYFVSSMYWNKPKKWKERFIGGEWFNTGDLASMDEDGYFYFKGRADDIISASGFRVGPAEVESALMEHEAIAEAAVVGKPDKIRGEIIKAFIVLKSGEKPTEPLAKRIQERVKGTLSKHSFPREIEFISELPKTSSGKILRRELRKLA